MGNRDIENSLYHKSYLDYVDPKSSKSDSMGVPKTKPPLPNPEPAKVRFGLRLREAREKMALSQELLADMSDMHRTYIGQVERGERNISVDNMEKLANAVGTELWVMLRP